MNDNEIIAEALIKIRTGILTGDISSICNGYAQISGEELECDFELVKNTKNKISNVRELLNSKLSNAGTQPVVDWRKCDENVEPKKPKAPTKNKRGRPAKKEKQKAVAESIKSKKGEQYVDKQTNEKYEIIQEETGKQASILSNQTKRKQIIITGIDKSKPLGKDQPRPERKRPRHKSVLDIESSGIDAGVNIDLKSNRKS